MRNIDVYAKKAARITGIFCAATGVLALSSVVISGAAVGAAIGLCKSTKDIVGKMWKDKSPSEGNTDAENKSIVETVPVVEENETTKTDN